MRTRPSCVAALTLLPAIGPGCQSTPIADDPVTEAAMASNVDMDVSERDQNLLDTARAKRDVNVIVQVDTEDETEAVELLERLKSELDDYGITLGREGKTWFSTTVTDEALILLLESRQM